MAKRDPERTRKLSIVVGFLVRSGKLEHGHQSRLAGLYGVTRQRVHQIVVVERERFDSEEQSWRDVRAS